MAELAQIMAGLQGQLKSISSEIGFNSTIASINVFDGRPEFCENFIRALDNANSILSDDHLMVRAALIRSSGLVSESIRNYIETTPAATLSWPVLKEKLELQFGIIRDQRISLQILRNTKQDNMSLPAYARLIEIRSSKAFPGSNLTEPLLQRQLVETFINGLTNDYIKKRLIIKYPSTLADALKNANEDHIVQMRLQAFKLGHNSNSNLTTQSSNVSNRHEIPMEIDGIGNVKSNIFATIPETHSDNIVPENATHSPQLENPLDISHSQQHEQYYESDIPPHDMEYPYGSDEPYLEFQDPESMFAMQGQHIKRCFICNSPQHLYKDCRHNSNHYQPRFPNYQPRYSDYRPRSYQNRYFTPRTPNWQHARPQPTQQQTANRHPTAQNSYRTTKSHEKHNKTKYHDSRRTRPPNRTDF